MPDRRGNITRMMHELESGDEQAADRLLDAIYSELRKIAAARLRDEKSNRVLEPTELVHEAYMRLVTPSNGPWNSRGHFFAAAAEAMRRILIDFARKNVALKRGGNADVVPLQPHLAISRDQSRSLLVLHEALARFEAIDPDKAALVKLRYFAGLTEEQACEALDISRATASRQWAYARAWLYDEITRQRVEQK